VKAQLDRYPRTGSAVGLALSGVVMVAGILTAAMARDSEYRAIPALWAIPGVGAAGLVASGIVFGLRSGQRRPYKLEQARLLLQKARLDALLAHYLHEGCVDLSSLEASHSARLGLIDTQLEAIDVRARKLSLTGPIVLLAAGGVITVGMALASIFLWLIVADADDHSEPVDRTPMYATFGSTFAGVAVAAGGGVWLLLRKRQRSAILREGNHLRLEKKRPEMLIVPQLGPTSAGLSLRGRF
jgi:hypothetical protein